MRNVKITPVSDLFMKKQARRDEINKLHVNIFELQEEFSRLVDVGKITLKYDQNSRNMQRMTDQIRFLTNAVEYMDGSDFSFIDENNDSLYHFLQSQIDISNLETSNLENSIHETDLQNFTHNISISFDCFNNNNEFNCKEAIPIVESYFDKLKTINLAYEDRFISSKEEKILHEREKNEKEKYAIFASTVDNEIQNIKRRS